jgi:predicted alpha/beta superfamily hydrolase
MYSANGSTAVPLWLEMNKMIRAISDGSGTLERFEQFPSQFVAARHVDVWLPPGYAHNSAQRFPVIYMHDGQNLFDPAESYSGIDWGIDEAVTWLVEKNQIPAPIIVGIWNSPLRIKEYMPQKAWDRFSTSLRMRFMKLIRRRPISDNYLRFIVSEVKPHIDQTYRTLPEQPHTFTMGSSMGALISLYAVLEYPDVFGGAGCVSTHWKDCADCLFPYVESALPAPGRHRFYFDFGTETIDAGYETYQRQVDEIMKTAGYRSGSDWLTLKFEGAEHNEQAWRERVHLPLKFLLEQDR